MAVLPDPGASQALLIGVHAYDGMEELPAVERNLAGLRQAWTDRDVWGLPQSHCTVLSQPPSPRAVLDTLGRVAADATDTLVVYYAGHGLTDPVTDELYLALPGSDPERTYSALPYDWVRRAMLDPRVRARRKVMILDCCYSGRALVGGMSAATEIASQVADHALIEGTCLIAASSATRKALSPPGERYTAFTGELITLLTEGVPDGPPLLDMVTVYRQLYLSLAAQGRPLPQQRNRNTGGLVALARNRASAPPTAPDAGQPARAHPARTESTPKPAPAAPRKTADDSATATATATAAASSPSAGPSSAGPSPVIPAPAPVTDPAPEPAPEPALATVPDPAPDPAPVPVPDPVPDPAPRRPAVLLRIGRSARVKVTAVAVVGLLAAGIPATLAWLLPGTSGGGEDGAAAAYDAASKGVVNGSKTPGGTLRFVSAGSVDSWDPQRSYYGHVWNFARYYTRQLVTYEAEPGAKGTRLVGDLATTTAKISDDRRTYTYKLRDGAAWEDGSEVTSGDVKYGIERLWAQDVLPGGPFYLRAVLDPDGAYEGPYKDTSESGLKTIRTPDKDTVVFSLPEANSDFEHMLAMTGASPVKKEKDTKARYGDRPFSSGPYRFRTDTPGKHLELVRNPHWDKSSDPVRAALPDKITVDVLNSGPDAVSKALMDGEYDLELGRGGLSQAADALVTGAPQGKENLDNLPTGLVRYAAFPQSVEPMDDIHCRKAVIHAADHKALRTVFGGPAAADDIAPSLLPPDAVGHEARYDPYGLLENGGEPDTAKAEAELEDCGKPDGFSTRIAVHGDRPDDVSAATVLRESLGEVGIKAEIDRISTERSVELFGTPAQVKAKGYGVIISTWGSDFPSLQGFWPPLVDGRLVPSSGNANLSEIDNKTINGLLDDAVSATGPEEVARISREINHEVSEGAYHLPIVHEKQLVWRGPRLTNVYRSAVYGGYDFASLGVTDS